IELMARAAGLMHDHKYLSKLYGIQADILNLKIIFRCYRDKIGSEQARSFILKNGYYLTDEKISQLLDAADISSLISALDGTPYQEILSEKLRSFDRTGSLNLVEIALDEFWASNVKSYYLQQPFGLTPIACYLSLKEIEITNIRAILNCIKLGLPKEKIRELLVGL
ncbi:MAG: V-type ATPase subunit, partial [Candidatus Diapherotrites archaeon]